MSDIVRDVGKIWDRFFDHKSFLIGEINFVLHEFEEKRKDQEVDNLFQAIEDITEIKDTEINRCRQIANQTLEELAENLEQSLDICASFNSLEEKYKEDTTLKQARQQRKIEWDNFMDDITTKYAEINGSIEAKEEELKKFYEDIEKKLLV